MQFSLNSPDSSPQNPYPSLPPPPHHDSAPDHARSSPLPEPELHIVTRVPVPAHLAGHVVDALHRFEPLVVVNPHFVKLEHRPVDVHDVAADLFFDGRSPGRSPDRSGDPDSVATFKPRIKASVIRQSIPVIPGLWSMSIDVPTVHQTFNAGVRCRASPKGATVRSTYSLQSTSDGRLELVDESIIHCSPCMKYFVKWNFEGSHRRILESFVESVAREIANKGDNASS